jgi:hypothetical protein
MSDVRFIDLFTSYFSGPYRRGRHRRRRVRHELSLRTLEYSIFIESHEPIEDLAECKFWHWEITFDGKPVPRKCGAEPTLDKACETAIRTATGDYGILSYELYERVRAAKEDAAVISALANQGEDDVLHQTGT